MPRNGVGTYALPSGNPVTTGTTISSTTHNNTLSDIATALTESLAKDGQTAMTGNLPMAGNKVTGLGNATATGDALTFAQLFSQGQQQDIASAETTDIGAPLTTLLNVTGTATITSFGTNYNGPRFLRFAGVCTLTNSATLVLPGGANITTAAGDSLIAVPLGNPATGWRVAEFTPAAAGYARLDGATFTGNVNVPSVNSGQLAGMRNKIINGKMELAQRGTDFTNPNDVYTLDRWKVNVDNLTDAAWSVSQNTAAQDAIGHGNLLRYSVTTVGSMTFADIRQPIEDVRTLQGKQVTVSFLLRYGAVGKAIEARLEQNFGSGGSAQVVTTVFTATGSTDAGFTRYSGTVTLPSVAGKTIGAGNNLALVLRLTAPNAGDYVDVTHVQLEEGSVATPFEHRPIGAELALCQRYYEVLSIGLSCGAISAASQTLGGQFKFSVTKRATPTINLVTGSDTQTAFPAGAASYGGVKTESFLAFKSSTAANTNANWYQQVTAAIEL